MTLAEWSWVTAAISIAGAAISSRSPRNGWIWGICAQFVWIAAGIATGQPGTVALSAVFIVVDLYSLWRWRGTAFVPMHRRHNGALQPIPDHKLPAAPPDPT